MKVAAIQHDIVWEDGAATRQHVTPLIAQAAAAGARLIVLPEMFSTGFSMQQQRIAEHPGGPTEQFLIQQAAEHGSWLTGSIAQWSQDGLAQNVAIVAGPDGQVHRYVKIHPFSYADEHLHYQAGSQFLTVSIDDVRVSVFVCYDLRFADEFWQLAADTDLYVVPANWPESRREHWKLLLRARAVENQAYVVGCNRVGLAGGKLSHVGDSAIIDPLGQTLTEASHVETVLIADVDPHQVKEVRDRFPFFADRR